MMKTPWNDAQALLSEPSVFTVLLWLLLATTLVIAVVVWSRNPSQRSLHSIGVYVLRVLMGLMWWEQTLWKIPPNFDGLRY